MRNILLIIVALATLRICGGRAASGQSAKVPLTQNNMINAFGAPLGPGAPGNCPYLSNTTKRDPDSPQFRTHSHCIDRAGPTSARRASVGGGSPCWTRWQANDDMDVSKRCRDVSDLLAFHSC